MPGRHVKWASGDDVFDGLSGGSAGAARGQVGSEFGRVISR
jgi:hypothetical protein